MVVFLFYFVRSYKCLLLDSKVEMLTERIKLTDKLKGLSIQSKLGP